MRGSSRLVQVDLVVVIDWLLMCPHCNRQHVEIMPCYNHVCVHCDKHWNLGSNIIRGSKNGAVLDDVYQYRLWRNVSDRPGRVLWLMLNPGTADASEDDPTIRRCIGFTKDWGYGCLEVVNLFAYRATNPKELGVSCDVVGPRNDSYIFSSSHEADLVVAAWGGTSGLPKAVSDLVSARAKEVRWSLFAGDVELMALAFTPDGNPRHPLCLKGDLKPEVWA